MIKQIKNIHNVIVDGPNGVGKSTLISNIFKKYNYRFMCYHRGDISNYVYAKLYHRQFFSTQRNLPFVHIVLLADEATLRTRIIDRAAKEEWSDEELSKELNTVHEIEMFKKAAEDMKNDYLIYVIHTSRLSEEEVAKRAFAILDSLVKNQPFDDESTYTSWNEQYAKACKVLGKKFKVIDNQPYIDDVPMLVESTCHEGAYETFSNKKCFDNLIYAYGYFEKDVRQEKKFDFNYIINSKIKRRPEIKEYYLEFDRRGKTCITSDHHEIEKLNLFHSRPLIYKHFGIDYLNVIAKSKATVYCARDLAYLKLQTGRLYESIIANNIVFVDKQSDVDCEILKSIWKDDEEMIQLLYVEPSTICDNYDKIISDEALVQKILFRQHEWLNNMFYELENGLI